MEAEISTVPDEKKPRGRPAKEQTPFGEWLRAHDTWTRATLAEAAGLSESHVKSLCNGSKPPSRTVALAIAQVTDGAFPIEAWGVPLSI